MTTVMQDVTKFIHEIGKTEELVVMSVTALNIHCIERGFKEIVTHENTLVLDIKSSDADSIKNKINEITSKKPLDIYEVQDIRESVGAYGIPCLKFKLNGIFTNKHINVYMTLDRGTLYKDNIEIINGINTLKLDLCIALEICLALSDLENAGMHISELIRLSKLIEGIKLQNIISCIKENELVETSVEMHKLNKDELSRDARNAYNMLEPIVNNSEKNLVWKCINAEQGLYDWVESN